MLPVVFLPGTLTDERIWINQMNLFPESTIVDLRHQDSLYLMLKEVESVKYESFHLIGFSMGGYIAQEFAINHPEKVASLTMVGSSSMGYPPEEKELVMKTLPLINPKSFKGITDKRLREYLHPHSYENPAIRNLIHEMAGADAAEVYLNQLKATLDRRPLIQELNSLTCPVTYIAGRDDQIVKLNSIEDSHKKVAHSHLEIINECGHFVPLEKPDELNSILLQTITIPLV